jgi:hypothetical protein
LRAFWSFTIGVAANVILGYFLSVAIFGSYWAGTHDIGNMVGYAFAAQYP